MFLPKTFIAALVTGLLSSAPLLADGHKPGCNGLDPATQSTNSACED
ncbi:hypothetical protein [Jannaschia marina]|nr:hypothetical protein [Jannaschia marina]